MFANKKRFLRIDLLIIVLILVASFITFTHVYVPSGKTLDLGLFTINVINVSALLAYYNISLLFSHIVFYSLWYITCNKWWKNIILLPFVSSVYKLIVYVFFSIEIPFKLAIYQKIIVAVLVGFILVFISSRAKYALKYKLRLNDINADNILKYKFKSVKQFRNFLNNLENAVYRKGLQQARDITAEAVVLTDSKEIEKENDSSSNYRLRDFFIVFIITTLPFIDRIYYLAPESSSWDLGWFVFSNSKFNDLVNFFYFFTYLYLTMFISLNIWFLTSTYWWKYFLLVPIIMTSYELISVLSPDVRYIHENEIIQALPILLLLTGFLIWISLKINNYSKVERIKEKIKVETFKIVALLAESENESKTVQLKEEIEATISNRDNYQPEEYLSRLENLYNQLSKIQNEN
ncbi:hypothetical protein HX109_14840 [Galbibacter sp. BG1]|uniref:hypothetical protein n=1 Tax=Galbibacter sp. BG1 TaxID=1170699 RepID=UPI0015B9CFF9|nr:hypothetical protein [Galbibacter sp. BG1]QLE02778.1 hypothetical protein HX109_14840 [Galbibacter sp. BG1]